MAGTARSLRSPASARLVLVSMGVVSIGVLAGCGEDDPTEAGTGTSVGDVQEDEATEAYDGPYTTRFAAEVESYDGRIVALSAGVNRVLGPATFTLAGTDDTTIQPLLVVAPDADTEVRADHTVAVTGTLHLSFDLAAVEAETGTDLDEELLERFDGKPYVTAGRIEASAPADR